MAVIDVALIVQGGRVIDIPIPCVIFIRDAGTVLYGGDWRKRMSRKPNRRHGIKPRHRNILPLDEFENNRDHYAALEQKAVYTGNPEHKRNPGDFGLEPPADPRWDKTLCDEVGILRRNVADRLLRTAFHSGLVSAAKGKNTDKWPQYVWAMTDDGHPLEAAYDGSGYHGYPLPDERTPLFKEIKKRWRNEK